MRRRAMFELFGGIAVGALSGFRFPGRRRDRVVVVGGGIIGASIAYHLARRGAQVTLVEKTRPAAGATQNSFAWINAGFGKLPFHYHRLNRLSMLAYRHLERQLDGQLRVQWGGSLQWTDNAEDAARLRQRVRRHQRWGYATRLVNEDEFHDLEPEMEPGTVMAAAHSEYEGSVNPVAATRALLQGAAAHGAQIQYPCEVTGLDMRWGAVQGIATTWPPT